MQDKHIDDEIYKHLYAIWSGDLDEGEFSWRYRQVIELITTERLAILERLLENKQLVRCKDCKGAHFFKAVPIEAIQQQINRIGGKE